MPQGLIRIVMPLLMVLAFLLYILFSLPDNQAEPQKPPASEAAE